MICYFSIKFHNCAEETNIALYVCVGGDGLEQSGQTRAPDSQKIFCYINFANFIEVMEHTNYLHGNYIIKPSVKQAQTVKSSNCARA